MEELEYISSSPDLQAVKRGVKPQDETDLPALERVLVTLDKQIDSYTSIDKLTLYDPKLSVNEQLAINQAVTQHLRELKLLVATTISDVKEKNKDE